MCFELTKAGMRIIGDGWRYTADASVWTSLNSSVCISSRSFYLRQSMIKRGKRKDGRWNIMPTLEVALVHLQIFQMQSGTYPKNSKQSQNLQILCSLATQLSATTTPKNLQHRRKDTSQSKSTKECFDALEKARPTRATALMFTEHKIKYQK